MKYTQGKTGRVFILKFEHEDDFYAELNSFCIREKINAASFQFLGAIKKSNVVVGPEIDIVPPKPIWNKIDEAKEVLGIGTVFPENGIPRAHIHSVFSKKTNAFLGCIREASDVFLVVEAILTEIVNVNVCRAPDEKTGLSLISIN